MSVDPTHRALDAMLAEYQTIRQESLESIGHRMTVMNFTFVTLGVIISGLLTRKVSDLLAGLIAVLFVPQIAKAALLIWLGEYQRSRRAGKWLAVLEQRINEAVDTDALGWESKLWSAGTDREATRHMGYPYVAVVVLLLGAGYTALALGIYLLFAKTERSWGLGSAVAVSTALAILSVCVELGFIAFFLKRWVRCQRGDV